MTRAAARVLFVALAAGTEWWVGRSGDWGLGAALRATFLAAPVDVAGVRAMLPHVDLFLPVHNLKSLVDLAKTLSRPLNKENLQWK